ncbi:MAG: Glucose 1-dehydrogenase 2 [Gemmatimonadaceae bacterium]|nr:Glucose 1-dehydrogenase 2 [Gemmatimonadaceae bacterium]
MELRGKVALVTGAGRRIGAAIAESLGGEGMSVAVHYRTSREGAELTRARVEAAGGRAWCVEGDLAQRDSASQLVDRVADRFGGLDVLINSAASMERTPFGTITVDDWDRILAVNSRAPFFLAQAAAAHMRSGGAIVNIADLAAFEIWPNYVLHGASKAAIVYLTEALARILAPAVRVNAVAPGVVLMPDAWDTSVADRLARTTPLKHNGTPDDVVGAIRYLLEADYVTGEIMHVDGGRRIR